MPSDVAGSRARSRRPSPRERLLKAADELFYAEGINSVGIDRVIERADVARASLYSTFGSKRQPAGCCATARASWRAWRRWTCMLP